MESAAKTLADHPFTSIWSVGLEMIEKFIRMLFFLSLPAIAWEQKRFTGALKKAKNIFTSQPAAFAGAYSMTMLVAFLLGLPLLIIFELEESGMEFSQLFWTGVIVYSGFIWSLNIYFEQMTTGLIYLWHRKWKEEEGDQPIQEISKPSLLDDEYELA